MIAAPCVRTFSLAAMMLFAWTASAVAVEQWGVYEVDLVGPAEGNPYLDVSLSARFTQGDRAFEVAGFYDGGDSYKIRFSPPTPGQWRYQTTSNRPALHGKTGSFTVDAATGNNHGPVEVFKNVYLRYADGSPYHQYGTTCYAWVHQPKALEEQTLKTLAASPFNKIRFCVFPKAYTYNTNEPEHYAFVKKADGKFDFTRPDPKFWRHFEQRIADLQRLGIEADLILWHPYDRWGFSEMGAVNDDRYLHYAIARLSAYRNVWWSLANEFDLMAPNAMKGHRGDKQTADWDRFFQILQKHDAHGRLRGIHNCRGFYDHTKPWVTHVSVQHSDLRRVIEWRKQYNKPVVVDECCYEGNIPQGWGNISAEEMNRRFWIGTLNGGYVGHGETYKHPQDILWWSKGGVLHGQSPQRIAWLKQLMAQAPAFDELQPQGETRGRFLLAKPGEYYLVYCLKPGTETIALAGDRPYKVDAIDPWAMTISAVGTAPAGEFALAAPRGDLAFRLTPYAAGEKLRPQPTITASALEGLPPLSVKFTASGGVAARWDFGDGASSDELNPTHVFRKPGFYDVSLTVTNADGVSARTFVQVAVDRNIDAPIVRVAVEKGETPELKLNGAARRTAGGALQLPAGEPWGWAEAGEGVIDDLRGLRSFTIAGWLKPDSLTTGSGGNRIAFCLNKDHSGIDLVCHADGRLRLAVNEWPDQVKNDSSPGKLQTGKWTYFLVAYNGTQPRENVTWYFSEPQDAPGPATAKLDRKTTYAAGQVGADIGPLAIGNFNATMRSHGLDRQFRGEIRALQIFGSRASGRGALTPDAIEKLAP
jgi:hypothetical protein